VCAHRRNDFRVTVNGGGVFLVKRVKSEGGEKVKFPTPSAPETVKSDTSTPVESQENMPDTVVETKETKDEEDVPVALSPIDLKRLGLTPGSRAWNLLLGSEGAGQQTPET